MNFFDAQDLPVSSSAPHSSEQPVQSLNDEVSEVVGQLSRIWGGFRRQSQTVFDTARKDLGDVVSQAQRGLVMLTQSDGAAAAGEPDSDASSTPREAEASDLPRTLDDGDSSLSSSYSEMTERGPIPSSPSSSYSNIFTRIQSALPPNIMSTVQKNIPESLKHASEQAEEYVHKSEALLREAMKEAGEVLKDIVKVVPPEEVDLSQGALWDGTDIWMLPTAAAAATAATDESSLSMTEGKAKEKASGTASAAQRAVATRAEALLRRLKHDPEIIAHNTDGDADFQSQFDGWLASDVDSKEGGIAAPEWKARADEALAEPVDGSALQATHDKLVPATMIEEEFWKRYFFRVYQIEREHERRKVFLKDASNEDEVFSWEDDEEEAIVPSSTTTLVPSSTMPTSETRPSIPTPSQMQDLTKLSDTSSPVFLSPRLSSEEGYDVVSSGSLSAGGEPLVVPKQKEDEQDSDWE